MPINLFPKILVNVFIFYSMLGYNVEHFPSTVVGSIIRIHEMAVQKWQGDFNGRVYDARSVRVVGDVHPSHYANEENSPVQNKRDKIYVKQLQRWWEREGQQKQTQSQSEELHPNLDARFVDVVPSTTLINLSVTVIDQIQTGAFSVLKVSDGTKCTMATLYFNKSQKGIEQQYGSTSHDIFVEGHKELLKLAKIGKTVHLKGVQVDQCESVSGEGVVSKFIIDHKVEACCQVVKNADSSIMDDSELNRLIAHALEVPNAQPTASDSEIGQSCQLEANKDPQPLQKASECNENSNERRILVEDSEDGAFSVPIFPANEEELDVREHSRVEDSSNVSDSETPQHTIEEIGRVECSSDHSDSENHNATQSSPPHDHTTAKETEYSLATMSCAKTQEKSALEQSSGEHLVNLLVDEILDESEEHAAHPVHTSAAMEIDKEVVDRFEMGEGSGRALAMQERSISELGKHWDIA